MKGYGFTYEGDIVEAAKWLPFAQSRLQWMLTTGAMIQSYNPTVNVMITVRSAPAHIHIKTATEGIYLESCFLTFSTTKCAEATYRPASVVFNSFVAAVNAQVKPLEGWGSITEDVSAAYYPFEGTALVAGQDSLALGFANGIPADTLTDPCGNTYTGGNYAPLSIRLRKLAQKHMPSSMFSGKLRLFVQAIYGSRRTDYWVNTDINDNYANDQRLYVSDVELNPMYVGSCGLYTTSDRRYFLLRVYAGVISFYPLMLSVAAMAFRDRLNTLTPRTELEAMAEAYIFAGSTISSTASHTVSFAAPPGGPIAYGWKFNKRGDKIRVITQTSSDGIIYTSYDTTVTVSETGSSGAYEFTAVASTLSGGRWKSCPTLAVWIPDWFLGEGLRYGQYVTGSELTSSEAYLYGYYDNDVWIDYTVTFAISAHSTGYVESSGANEADLANHPTVIVAGCGEAQPTGTGVSYTTYTYTSAGRHGVMAAQFGGANMSVLLREAHNYYRNWWEVVAQGTIPSATGGVKNTSGFSLEMVCGGTTIHEYMSSNYSWTMHALGYSYQDPLYGSTSTPPNDGGWSIAVFRANVMKLFEATTDATSYAGVSLIVPFDDCQSVTYAQTTAAGSTGTESSGYDTQDATDSLMAVYEHTWENQGGGLWGWSAVGSLSTVVPLQQRSVGRPYSQSTSSAPAGPVSYTAALDYACSGTAHYGAAEVDGYHLYNSSGDGYAVAWVDKYFKHSLSDPTLHPHPIVHSSYGGSNGCYTEETPDYNRNGFPDTDSAVGWV